MTEDKIRSYAVGPYVVWQYYPYEGWNPMSYLTLKEAIESQKYQSIWTIQRPVEYQIFETEPE